jgi:orotidine-5'-phosphate decarboxylase
MKSNRNFMEMFRAKQEMGKSVCIGIDTRFADIPKCMRGRYGSRRYETRIMFNNSIISQTHDIVCAYMADDAFYRMDAEALRVTVQRARAFAPDVPFVLGCYGGGVEHSNAALIEYAFDYIGADAIAVNPYFGRRGGLEPFLNLKNKGVIVLCRTSNQGVEDFQNILSAAEGVPLWKTVAWRVASYWNDNSNCALLMGPTSHGELSQVRSIVPHMPIFVTGIGQQNETGRIEEDDVREIVVNGRNGDGRGFVVCSSRGVILAPNPRQETERLHRLVEKYRGE